jgi:hypothetical protein
MSLSTQVKCLGVWTGIPSALYPVMINDATILASQNDTDGVVVFESQYSNTVSSTYLVNDKVDEDCISDAEIGALVASINYEATDGLDSLLELEEGFTSWIADQDII